MALSAEILNKLSSDLEFFSSECLKIRRKDGMIAPFIFNKAQRYLHERVEDQRRRTGMVRLFIVKGRQVGASTYIAARGYWRVTWLAGQQAYILAHELEATANLFSMVERFHEHNPVRHGVLASNAKELRFEGIDSGYKVGTAGTKAVGRSATVQFFHASECGYWANAEEHKAGILQTV